MKNGTRSVNAASVIVASLIFSVSSSADDTLFRNWPMTETNITLALEEGRKQRREGCELVLGRSRSRGRAWRGGHPQWIPSGLSVSTPFSLICGQSAWYAVRQMEMTRDDVTEEMLRPMLTVVARPGQPVDGRFDGLEGVNHVVIASTAKKNPKILEPVEAEQRADTYQTGTGAPVEIPYYVVGYFDLEEVIALSKLDKKREFFIIRVATNGSEKKFKIKTKHFKHLR